MAQLLGADRFVWASDFPHIGAELGVVHELNENLASLSAADQARILGGNVRSIYNLGIG
jgi:predicted TIM-barrel fold metal-dependent hydrolase